MPARQFAAQRMTRSLRNERQSRGEFDTGSVSMNNDTSTPSIRPGWVTETQLARHLQISRRHLHNLRLAGMPHILLGSSVRFDLSEVESFIRSNRRLSSHVQRQQRRAALAASVG